MDGHHLSLPVRDEEDAGRRRSFPALHPHPEHQRLVAIRDEAVYMETLRRKSEPVVRFRDLAGEKRTDGCALKTRRSRECSPDDRYHKADINATSTRCHMPSERSPSPRQSMPSPRVATPSPPRSLEPRLLGRRRSVSTGMLAEEEDSSPTRRRNTMPSVLSKAHFLSRMRAAKADAASTKSSTQAYKMYQPKPPQIVVSETVTDLQTNKSSLWQLKHRPFSCQESRGRMSRRKSRAIPITTRRDQSLPVDPNQLSCKLSPEAQSAVLNCYHETLTRELAYLDPHFIEHNYDMSEDIDSKALPSKLRENKIQQAMHMLDTIKDCQRSPLESRTYRDKLQETVREFRDWRSSFSH